MRSAVISLVLVTFATIAMAQEQGASRAPQAEKTFASSAEVVAFVAEAKRDIKPGQTLIAKRILYLAPYSANLQYRPVVGIPELHEREAEVFYVIAGSGTMTTGGKLVNKKAKDAENFTGTTIEGGKTQALSKGDIVIVPENTPHWFSGVNEALVLVTMHVPRPLAGTR